MRRAGIDRAELRFRQICCLSTSGPLLAPSLFRELHAVLPFASCLYMWLGPTGPVDAYYNVPEVGQYLPLYSDAYFRRAEAEVWATTDEALRHEFGPHLLPQVLRISTADYFRHPLYNEIMRPSNVHTFIRHLVRDDGRPVGTFTISRGPDDRDFSVDDVRILERLEPFIRHALAKRKDVPLTESIEDTAGMIIVDRIGEIQTLSPSAKLLLPLSQGSALAPLALPNGLMETVRVLQRVARGQAVGKVPAWKVRNAWGSFSGRAYWLEGARSPGSDIGIFLERKVPIQLRIIEGLHHISLPPRQEEVALRLALGRSEEEVAEELGVSRNTVTYHRRQIYNRLGIDSRSLLVKRLIDAPGMSSPT